MRRQASFLLLTLLSVVLACSGGGSARVTEPPGLPVTQPPPPPPAPPPAPAPQLGTIIGQVLNAETGEAIAGAQIAVSLNLPLVFSDASGSYVLEGIQQGSFVTLTVSREGFLETTVGVVVSAPTTLANVRLSPVGPPPTTGSVVGRITEHNTGRAISGAPVGVSPASAGIDALPSTLVHSDPLGNYVVEGLLPGEFVVTVSQPDFGFQQRTVFIRAGEVSRLDFTLSRIAPPPPTVPPPSSCCRRCTTGKPCGNSCIARSLTCHQPPGCACFG
jgi:hypothetical protein